MYSNIIDEEINKYLNYIISENQQNEFFRDGLAGLTYAWKNRKNGKGWNVNFGDGARQWNLKHGNKYLKKAGAKGVNANSNGNNNDDTIESTYEPDYGAYRGTSLVNGPHRIGVTPIVSGGGENNPNPPIPPEPEVVVDDNKKKRSKYGNDAKVIAFMQQEGSAKTEAFLENLLKLSESLQFYVQHSDDKKNYYFGNKKNIFEKFQKKVQEFYDISKERFNQAFQQPINELVKRTKEGLYHMNDTENNSEWAANYTNNLAEFRWISGLSSKVQYVLDNPGYYSYSKSVTKLYTDANTYLKIEMEDDDGNKSQKLRAALGGFVATLAAFALIGGASALGSGDYIENNQDNQQQTPNQETVIQQDQQQNQGHEDDTVVLGGENVQNTQESICEISPNNDGVLTDEILTNIDNLVLNGKGSGDYTIKIINGANANYDDYDKIIDSMNDYCVQMGYYTVATGSNEHGKYNQGGLRFIAQPQDVLEYSQDNNNIVLDFNNMKVGGRINRNAAEINQEIAQKSQLKQKHKEFIEHQIETREETKKIKGSGLKESKLRSRKMNKIILEEIEKYLKENLL